MNFLGHAYLARKYPQLIAGNFAGDSYKGKIENFDQLDLDILNGIRLHRFIDDFTDSSDNVIQAVRIFQKEGVNKVGFIASDILIDHHLSRLWKNYSEKEYSSFVDDVYRHTESRLDDLHQEFQWLYSNLKRYGWLYDYPSIEGIEKIMKQFSRRIGFENDLMKTIEIYQREQDEIDGLFEKFLSEIDLASETHIVEILGQNS